MKWILAMVILQHHSLLCSWTFHRILKQSAYITREVYMPVCIFWVMISMKTAILTTTIIQQLIFDPYGSYNQIQW
jgi:hypothetical protein